MAGQSDIGLVWRLRTVGAQEVQRDLQRVGGAGSQALGAIRRGLHGLGGMAQGLARSLSGIPAMLAGGLGAAAFVELGKKAMDFDRGLLALGYQAEQSSAQVQELGRRLTEMHRATGVSREELLGAADAAADLGMNLWEAMDVMQQTAEWAGLMGTDVATAVPAVAGLRKIAGRELPKTELLAALDLGAKSSGMDEAKFLALVGRLAPKMAGIAGMSGAQGVGELLGMIASAGETFGADPKQMRGALTALVGEIRGKGAQMRGMGVDTGTLGSTVSGLSGLSVGALESLGLPEQLMQFLTAVSANREALTSTTSAVRDAGQRVPQLEKALASWAQSQPHQWKSMVAELGVAFEPYARQAFGWVIENKGEIVGSILELGTAFGSLAVVAGGVAGQLGATGAMATLLAMRVSPLLGLFVALAAWIDKLMGNEEEKKDVAEAAGGGLMGNVVATAANITGGERALERARAASEGGWGTAIGAGAANLAEGLGQGVAGGIDRAAGIKNEGRSYSSDRSWYEYVSQAFDVSEYLPRGRTTRGRMAPGFGERIGRDEQGGGRSGGGSSAEGSARDRPITIAIQQTTNVSPDGTSGTARANTDARNGATVQVRDEYSGAYRPPRMQ